MPDVIITPASGQIDFQDNGSSKALIKTDANGNLAITNTGGSLSVGNTASDVYIGDGINNVNLRFDLAGSILPTSGQALTIGSQSSGPIHIGRQLRLKPQSGTEGGELQFDYINGTVGYYVDVQAANHLRFGNSDTTGQYLWSTNNSERMRINGSGNGSYLRCIGSGSTYNDTNGNYYEFNTNVSAQLNVLMRHAAVDAFNVNLILWNARSNTSGFSFLSCWSGGWTDVEFYVRGDGNVFADGVYTANGADYAEYFEWLDGNENTEDRRGFTVVLEGDKIRKAEEGEDPIGVISASPSVIGDAAANRWSEKFLKDDFGSFIVEEHNVVEWEELETSEDGVSNMVTRSYEDWNIPEDVVVPEDAVVKTHDDKGNRFLHRKLNPDYDPNMEYIPREERKEWDAVGMMGKLRIRKGQVTGSRWIKMRDISATVEEWLVR
jgi:hypothetical protein